MVIVAFWTTITKQFPFRDGVSESQFIQVINIELDQIIEVVDLQFLHICLADIQLIYWLITTSNKDF